MEGRTLGWGAFVFGAGALSYAAGVMYAAPGMDPIAYCLMGLGGAFFARGLLSRVRGALTGLLFFGAITLGSSALFFAVAREATPAAYPVLLTSLSWTIALIGVGAISTATATPQHA